MLSAQFEDLEGTIDIVAFPRAYEKFLEFWTDDNIVALTGKIDQRRDTLQLIVDSVAPLSASTVSSSANAVAAPMLAESALAYLPEPLVSDPDQDGMLVDDDSWRASLPVSLEAVTNPPPSAAPPAAPAPRPAPAREEPAPPVSHAAPAREEPVPSRAREELPAPRPAPAAPARAREEPAAPPVPPAASAPPVTVLRPRQRITIAKKDEAPAPAAGGSAPSAASAPAPQLHITLRRTGNDDEDIRCMQEVHKLLCRFDGHHKVMLYVPQDSNQVILESLRRANPSPELLDHLTALLGDGAVWTDAGR